MLTLYERRHVRTAGIRIRPRRGTNQLQPRTLNRWVGRRSERRLRRSVARESHLDGTQLQRGGVHWAPAPGIIQQLKRQIRPLAAFRPLAALHLNSAA